MAGFPKIDFSKLLSRENLDYFLSPKETGYDVPKTALYAVLLIAAAYGIYKLLKWLKIKIDRRLAVAIAPYVVFGGCLRVLEDAGLTESYLFITPGIYVFVSSVLFIVLLVSIVLQKKFKIEYYKSVFIIGLLLLPFTLSQLNFTNLQAVGIIALILAPLIAVFKFKLVKWPASNKIVLLLQIFDATTTFVAISLFGYSEQHVLPTFFINIFGPISFVILKIVAVFSALYLIDKFAADREFGLYLKLIIGILGAATGTRDIISLAAGI